jgi:eukaryotic-like serine/threonine-protein kinase
MTEPKRIGKYEILEEIGRGGFAAVYKARDPSLDRIVALKVLHPYWSEDPSFATRFRGEARAAAKLRHPNIVTVYETGEADGQLYIAMEYLPGRTLRALLGEEGALLLEQALPILEQISDALDYAHEHGVIHRDVKPANIMVEEAERGVRVTLMDFGLVKAMESSAAFTLQGTLLGSPEYMAPEQADPDRAAEIGPATDRYALGIMAYQMLTGRVPFAGNTPSTLVAHLQKTPPDPHSIRESLPADVGQVLLRMLSKSPGNRYPSASTFVAALRNASAESQMRRRPQPKPLRVVKPESKPRKPVPVWVWIVAGALILAVACGGLIASFIYTFGSSKATATLAPVLSTPAAMATPTAIATQRPPTATPAPTRTPAPGETQTRSVDGMVMVYVPGGAFQMGSADSDKLANFDEKPQHPVTLNAFWIDKTEVTNAQYKKCVQAGACKASEYTSSDLNGDNLPVSGVSWYDAKAYCQWTGAALPTEAQWEKAARGTDGRLYPWGNQPATCEYAVMVENGQEGCGKIPAWPVGSKPKGASLYGAFDMAGNVSEWVEDWYADNSYAAEAQTNPSGPMTGTTKVLRGGSWYCSEAACVRAAKRDADKPDDRNSGKGFRCVAAESGPATPTAAREPAPSATRIRPADWMVMVYVPGDPFVPFVMGSADNDPTAQSDEKPQHDVYLNAFWIDRTEVTNAQYKYCAQAGACKASTYADKSNLNGDNQPVTGVNWNDAAAYCRWVGATLPTEAQWEKAAKGDGYRVYPWGNQTATCDFAVMKDDKGNGCGKGDAPWSVGSKPKGASPYGALDMAGNVSEWVADWYGAYPAEYQVNPTGPTTGTRKVLRGGSWVNTWPNVRAAARENDTPENHADNIGFRCVMTP